METIHPLKTYRERHVPPLTQEQLAEQLGVTKASVSRWETGERKPEQTLLPGIAAKTGIPASALRPDLAGLFSPPKVSRRKARSAAA